MSGKTALFVLPTVTVDLAKPNVVLETVTVPLILYDINKIAFKIHD